MSFAAVAVGVSLAGLGTSIGMAASGAGQPVQPNLAASSAQLADTNANLLPFQRGLAAAQQTGGSYTFQIPKNANPADLNISSTGGGWYNAQGQLISSDPNYAGAKSGLQWGENQSERGASTNGLSWKPGQLTMHGIPLTKNPDGSYTVSFKGVGQGQVESQVAEQNAADQLKLSQEFDPQFIAQALQEQQQADPESAAARAEESNLIQEQISRPLNDPVSEMLNSQVQESLDAAKNGTLTGVDQARLAQAVADAQSTRGGAGPNADFAQPLTTGFAGEQRQATAAGGAQSFLGSGSSPEDIAYRREQQNLSNLSSEVNGATPESEFSSMTGAQSGPTPNVTAGPLPTMPGGQGEAAQQTAIQNAQTQNRFNNNQVNPWMQGVSSLISVGNAAGNLGFQPFAPAS